MATHKILTPPIGITRLKKARQQKPEPEPNPHDKHDLRPLFHLEHDGLCRFLALQIETKTTEVK